MRRSKREERRILTRYLSLWDESRHRRTFHKLRNLCDSRSSGRIAASAPTYPAASTSLNSHLFVLYIFGGQLSPVVISVHGIEQIGNPHDNHRNG